MYIAIAHGTIVKGRAEHLSELCLSVFDISIKNGEITINDYKNTFAYNMEQFTEGEAIKDFCRSVVPHIAKRWSIEILKVYTR